MENFNNELLEKAKQAKSAEEILALAKENGLTMTEEQAKAAYAKFHPTSGEIEDDELENVAGGGCGASSSEKFESGDRVYCANDSCPTCGSHYGVIHTLMPIMFGGSVGYLWGVNCECGAGEIMRTFYPAQEGVTKA